MHYGVTFNFGSAKVCSPAILETCFCYDKDIWIAATDCCNTLSLHTVSFSWTLFSPLKHYLDLYITHIALKVSLSFYCFTTISHGVENYFPRLWGTGISDAIFL